MLRSKFGQVQDLPALLGKVVAMLGMSASVVNVESMGRLRLATVEVAVLSVIIVTSLMIKILAKTTTWRQWR